MMGIAHAGIDDYNNASLYPKRVRSMQFTHPLDATHGVKWQGWGVDFGKDLPTAAWGTRDGFTTVTIGHLLCPNARGDAHLCDFEINFDNKYGQLPYCSIDDVDSSYVVDLQGLICPNSIEFVR
jgi:hypothetical protein